MRKKTILGSYVRHCDVLYTHAIQKVADKPETYAALITFLPGCRELRKHDQGHDLLLAGEGCRWLMILPLEEYWCVTAAYSPQGKLLEWYFDISRGNFLDEEGMPCTDDIFLDLVIYPDGGHVTLDEDELQEALDKGEITQQDCRHAYSVRDGILDSKWGDPGFLTGVSDELLAGFDPQGL